MATYIKQGDIFGRVGSGIGQGLAQQLPEEITRGRLAAGLQNLEGQQNLTPFQQFSRLAAIPGITPQMLQSGAELLRQQGISQGLRNVASQQQELSPSQILRGKQIPTFDRQSAAIGQQPNAKGYVTPEQTGASIKPYIPKDLQQLQARAAELADENPQLYPTAKDALAGAVQEDQSLQNQNVAQQQARASAKGVQEDVRKELQALRAASNVQIPDRLYQEVENDVLDKIEGGANELDAQKEGQKKLHELSQRFNNIAGWGSLRSAWLNKDDFRQSIRSAQRDAKKGGYQKEAAEYMIAHNKVTPQFAFSLMNPVSDYPELNKQIRDLPSIESEAAKQLKASAEKNGIGSIRELEKLPTELTRKVAPKLAKAMGLQGSPLAIMREIEKKGYDGQEFKRYLLDNQDSLNLSTNQINELQQNKPSFFGLLNDFFLSDFSGVE